MINAIKKSKNKINWQMEVLKLKEKLPRNYVTFYRHYFPNLNTDQEISNLRNVMNLRHYDKAIIARIEKLINLIKVK